MPSDLKLLVTLLPSFPHFLRFAMDRRVASIRLNSAATSIFELDDELKKLSALPITGTPLFFDIKGRQMRIDEVIPNDEYLDIRLNHPIVVDTPVPVLFKAGADSALLKEVCEDGYRLKFFTGPEYEVKVGDSLHIRDSSLIVGGDQFTGKEIEKIEKVKAFGFENYFLSYVESQRDVDEFIDIVGDDCTLNLKIESKKGLRYVRNEFVKKSNLNLVAARGDLYVELDKPHEIIDATRLIVEKDPDAIVGSRILLSTINSPVPSCADFSELAWLYDIGYRNIMLCDELCIKENLLGVAVSVFDAFRKSYWIDTSKPRDIMNDSDVCVINSMSSPKKKSWWRIMGGGYQSGK